MNREKVSLAIQIAFYLLGLVVAWQAVRFWQGITPNPLMDPLPVQDSLRSFSSLSAFYQYYIAQPAYYILGIIVWLWLGMIVMFSGKVVGRVTEVGFTKFYQEFNAALEEERKWARIESDRRRRREMRRKLKEEKSGGSGGIAFVIGAFLGSILF